MMIKSRSARAKIGAKDISFAPACFTNRAGSNGRRTKRGDVPYTYRHYLAREGLSLVLKGIPGNRAIYMPLPLVLKAP